MQPGNDLPQESMRGIVWNAWQLHPTIGAHPVVDTGPDDPGAARVLLVTSCPWSGAPAATIRGFSPMSPCASLRSFKFWNRFR